MGTKLLSRIVYLNKPQTYTNKAFPNQTFAKKTVGLLLHNHKMVFPIFLCKTVPLLCDSLIKQSIPYGPQT